MNAVAVQAITSSTNAAPIEITKNSHGYVTGDRITVNGHATNTAANGTWYVTRTGANTFTLDGSTGNGVGGATGAMAKACGIALTEDFTHAVFNLAFATSPTMTVKLAGAISESSPDFAATQSPSNAYDFIDMTDLQDGSSIDGDTGVAVAGTADVRQFEANINGIRWLSFLPTAGSAGTVTITARLFSNS